MAQQLVSRRDLDSHNRRMSVPQMTKGKAVVLRNAQRSAPPSDWRCALQNVVEGHADLCTTAPFGLDQINLPLQLPGG